MGVTGLGVVLALLVSAGLESDDPSERLYGRVHTKDGSVVEGFLRWDRNEVSRTDFLDGAKEIPAEQVREAESLDPEFAERQRRARSIVAFGRRISWDEDDLSDPLTTPAGIRFGHIESLEVLDGRSALLRLVGGGEVRLDGSGSDLGTGMRRLVVEGPGGRAEEIGWSELERIDFLPVPPSAHSPAALRLHGTVTTWEGLELTGNVAWDLDEVLDEDVLDGRADGEDMQIAFREISEIAWESERSARVFLRTGEEIVLRGTNDVDRSNRGIEVSDPGFGRATVSWADFRSVRFHRPGQRLQWPAVEAGRPLRGTVHAADGRVIEGEIRWDNDETAAWESIEGWSGDVDLDVEFAAIRSIAKSAADGVTVTLLDGRTFALSGSASVDERNKGVFVKPDGRPRRLVRWWDFERLELVW
jgi:hypothetical protein